MVRAQAILPLLLLAALVACDDGGTEPDAPPSPDAPLITVDGGDGADAAAPDAAVPDAAVPDATPSFTLTVGATAGGTVTSDPAGIACTATAGADCDESYLAGTSVELTAAADADFGFAGWGGDCAAAAAPGPATVVVDAARACSATFVGVTGEVTLIPPPTSVVPNATEDATAILLFMERQALTLAQALPFDAHVPDTYTTTPPTGGVVPAGTEVNVYFVHFDPPGSTVVTRTATVTFPDPVIAVITDTPTLEATDPVVGHPQVIYPTAGTHPERELELIGNQDGFSISADRRTLVLTHTTSTSADQLRVITTTGGAQPPFIHTSNIQLLASPPAAVTVGATESSTHVTLFLEGMMTLAAALGVDVTAPGTYTSAAGLGGSVAAGATVESWFLHFDPVGGALASQTVSVSFTRSIAGLILLDAGLDASDLLLGAPVTAYPAAGAEAGRGVDLSASERVFFAADGKSVRLQLSATTATDSARVVLLVP